MTYSCSHCVWLPIYAHPLCTYICDVPQFRHVIGHLTLTVSKKDRVAMLNLEVLERLI